MIRCRGGAATLWQCQFRTPSSTRLAESWRQMPAMWQPEINDIWTLQRSVIARDSADLALAAFELARKILAAHRIEP